MAGFSAHEELSKAPEVSVQVMRINNQLKECQALAQKYNNRERLFNMQVTSVSVKLNTIHFDLFSDVLVKTLCEIVFDSFE